ncbi:DgyrCDS13915 [Dimorphilus gyrociliatus]|uniref:DgyrCDS13915 n=1 Tax=Dimorphilus gyrociliatus TaxID=2664684 RepID=A0A7I8WC79_9ANNE|nr:DgyrCDS13915 [Dimorphilus gyrociliatus]
MRRSLGSKDDLQVVKGMIEGEVKSLQTELARMIGKFKSLESVHTATLEQLSECRIDVNQSENCLKLYEKEINSLQRIYENEETKILNLKAENQGLLALFKIANNLLKSGRNDQESQNLLSNLDEKIAKELPNGIQIYSNITNRLIGNDNINAKFQSETTTASLTHFLL